MIVSRSPSFKHANAGKTQLNGLHSQGGHSGGLGTAVVIAMLTSYFDTGAIGTTTEAFSAASHGDRPRSSGRAGRRAMDDDVEVAAAIATLCSNSTRVFLLLTCIAAKSGVECDQGECVRSASPTSYQRSASNLLQYLPLRQNVCICLYHISYPRIVTNNHTSRRVETLLNRGI